MTNNFRAKVSDFNLSKTLEDNPYIQKMNQMNPRWVAPEVLQGHPPSLESDVFSFAVVMWEIVTLSIPWASEEPPHIAMSVMSGIRLPVPDSPGGITQYFYKNSFLHYLTIMQQCWQPIPQKRPTMKVVTQELSQYL